MNMQLEEAWADENEENKTQKIDFVFLEIRSLIFCLIFDPINDQICY